MLNLSTESGDRWLKAAERAHLAGQLENSLQFCEKALAANPGDLRALAAVAAVGVRGGAAELAMAISILQKAAAGSRGMEAWKHLGVCLYRAGRLDEALAALENAKGLGGERDAGLLDILGIVLIRRGDPAAAADCFQRAIAIRPDAPLYTNLGAALLELGKHQESYDACLKAVELNPSDVMARHNLGKVLVKLERVGEAAAELEIAITLRPDQAELWCTLGIAHSAGGAACRAIAALKRSLEIRPSVRAQSQLLFVMHEAGREAGAILAEARRWDEIYGALPPTVPAVRRAAWGTDRVLRVGYLSGDFRKHPVATFIAPLLQSHNCAAVEVFCYSHVGRPDRMTEWLRSLTPQWRDIARLGDAEAADVIRVDGVDVLVDLQGHCSGNRLGIMARRPAAVQMTYLGYPGTTGLKAMDYRLTAALLDPPGETEQFCSEKLLRIDGPFAVYGMPDTAPPLTPLPMEKNGECRFASFASRGKVSDAVLRTWARIMGRVEKSRLDLYAFDRAEAERVHGLFALHGVAAERVRLLGRLDIQDYFAVHRDVDILLDTFPLSGHTVICHGLWMGVPAVCLRGKIYWERLGAAVMEWAGLKEFIAGSVEEYVEIAVGMAQRPEVLSRLRREMRERLRASPLLDYAGHARRVEEAYRSAWTAGCS